MEHRLEQIIKKWIIKINLNKSLFKVTKKTKKSNIKARKTPLRKI